MNIPTFLDTGLASLVGLLLRKHGGRLTFTPEEMKNFSSTVVFFIGRTNHDDGSVTFYIEDLGHVRH